VTVGSVLLVVPGVFAFLVWAAAAPACVMERAGPVAALRRSVHLTRGHRGRILGVTLLVVVISYAVELVVSALALAPFPSLSGTAALIASTAVGAVVSAVTMSWTAAVIALLYVDIRLRR